MAVVRAGSRVAFDRGGEKEPEPNRRYCHRRRLECFPLRLTDKSANGGGATASARANSSAEMIEMNGATSPPQMVKTLAILI